MKRYTHAWIAIKAIERLSKIVEILQGEKEFEELNKPKKTTINSIEILKKILDEKLYFIVEGAWIPDNIISDNRTGHIWKYLPVINNVNAIVLETPSSYKGHIYFTEDDSDRKYFRIDHKSTKNLQSLCVKEAERCYAWDKPWRKEHSGGILVDRCQGMSYMIRDMFLLRQDEIDDIAATIHHKFNGEEVEKKYEVSDFLFNPSNVSAHYKGLTPKGKTIKSEIRRIKHKKKEYLEDCIKEFSHDIDNYITRHIGISYVQLRSPMFPLFFNKDLIALTFFSMSHYISDAHMPLHCDVRPFSEGDNIHGIIEDEWEKWVIDKDNKKLFDSEISEYNRGKSFIEKFYPEDKESIRYYKYPKDTLLYKMDMDEELRKLIWEERPISFPTKAKNNIWEEMVAVAYSSYCLSSRLMRLDDTMSAVPELEEDKEFKIALNNEYVRDLYGPIININRDNWKEALKPLDDDEINKINRYRSKKKLDYYRKRLLQFCQENYEDEIDITFNYLSLCILLDSIDCVSKLWARSIKNYLDIKLSKN